MEIAYLHQKLGNYDLAIELFQEAASRLKPSQSLKGVALYEVGRTMSWNDNWHEGYKFLKSTDATMDLVNEDLKRNLKGVHAYYPYSEKNRSDSPPDTAEKALQITQENEIRSKYVEVIVPKDLAKCLRQRKVIHCSKSLRNHNMEQYLVKMVDGLQVTLLCADH